MPQFSSVSLALASTGIEEVTLQMQSLYCCHQVPKDTTS